MLGGGEPVLEQVGTTQRFESRMIPFNEQGNELFEVVGLSRYRELERRFGIGAPARKA